MLAFFNFGIPELIILAACPLFLVVVGVVVFVVVRSSQTKYDPRRDRDRLDRDHDQDDRSPGDIQPR